MLRGQPRHPRSANPTTPLILTLTGIDLVRRVRATNWFEVCNAVPLGEASHLGIVAEADTGVAKNVARIESVIVPNADGIVV